MFETDLSLPHVYYSVLPFPVAALLYFFLSGRVRMVQRHFSRFGFPCFTIPDFVILTNKTVP